ncbi:hypothetical protein ACNOYE_31675 [Nannocystaceae bacterium ST9]
MRRASLTFALVLVLTGCDFFKELQSVDSGDTGTDTGDTDTDETADDTGDETSDEPCDVLDEHCENQDTLVTCDAESGELITWECASLCDTFLNFTCTPTDEFTHACWCVSPGNIKLTTCAELEVCVNNCGDPDGTCSQQCFADTDATTIRLLGTLWSCADLACDEICATYPEDCSSCLGSARAGLWGDCGVERSVCDADQTDEPSWP